MPRSHQDTNAGSAPRSLDSTRRAWPVFAIVWALMVVDFVDRNIVVSMLPHLKAEWKLSDGQLGALVSVVAVTVAIGTVPLSLLADRWSRVKSVFLMAIVWSGATIACVFAVSYEQLLAARAVVGVGEAAYGPVGAALLASRFPARIRTGVLGAFFAASLLGSVLGMMLGGLIADRWGWQAGFGVAGLPGLLLAATFILVVREDELGVLPDARRDGRGTWIGARAVADALLRPRTLLLACVGGALQLALVSSVFTWLPSYFHRHYGLAPDHAGVRTGIIVLLGGIGALFWSVAADRFSRAWPRARLQVSAVASMTTAVLMGTAFAVLDPGPAQLALIVAGAIAMTGTLGPVAAVVMDVVHPSLRATASSVLALAQNLAGLAAGPLVAGVLSDRYGLPFALSVVPLFCVLAAAVFVFAARTYASDVEDAKVQERAPGEPRGSRAT